MSRVNIPDFRHAGTRAEIEIELELGAELVVRHVGDASTARRLAVALVAPDLGMGQAGGRGCRAEEGDRD